MPELDKDLRIREVSADGLEVSREQSQEKKSLPLSKQGPCDDSQSVAMLTCQSCTPI